jgi:hypothetical protein
LSLRCTNLILKCLKLVFDRGGRIYILNSNELVHNQYLHKLFLLKVLI